MSDVKFAFANSERTIAAHKYVLAVSSPVFFAMFYGDLAEKDDAIDITDCDPDIFLLLLRFIYCNEANFPDIDCAVKILYLADKYDIPSLASECVAFLDVTMDPLSAFDIIPHARRLNSKGLEKICWEVIDYNAQAIVADDSFMDTKRDLLLAFLERSSLRIEETSLFEAVNRWAARRCEEAGMPANGENKRAVLGEDLLKHFRFSLMTPSDFSDTVLPTDILATTEVIDVFKQFTSVPIPGGFKFSLSSRQTGYQPLQSFSTGQPYVLGIQGMEQTTTGGINGKSGALTFALNKDIMLCGVQIITASKILQDVPVTLTITQSGKKIRQVKGQYCAFKQFRFTGYCGVANIVFNRPVPLSMGTCYTIETDTFSTRDMHSCYVACESLQQQSTLSTPDSSRKTAKEDIPVISRHFFGNCAGNCPAGRRFVGEITQLIYTVYQLKSGASAKQRNSKPR